LSITIDNNVLYLIIGIVVTSIMAWGAWITKKVFAHDSCMARVEEKLDNVAKTLNDRKPFFNQIPVIATKLDDLIESMKNKKDSTL
jgi:hypothetical protein